MIRIPSLAGENGWCKDIVCIQDAFPLTRMMGLEYAMGWSMIILSK